MCIQCIEQGLYIFYALKAAQKIMFFSHSACDEYTWMEECNKGNRKVSYAQTYIYSRHM